MIGLGVDPRPADQLGVLPRIQTVMVGQEGCCKDALSWATTACGSLVENEAQETEGSRAESLKGTDRDAGQPWQQS